MIFIGDDDPEVQDGTATDDELSGNGGDDRLQGLDGNDILGGGDQNDWLNGGLGDDVVRGGAHSDTIEDFDGGNDRLYGDSGDDLISIGRDAASADAIRVFGGTGDDVITYLGDPDNAVSLYVSASEGADIIRLEATVDAEVVSGAGDDRIELTYSQDLLVRAGDGADVVVAAYSMGGLARIDMGAGDDQVLLIPGDPGYGARYAVTLGQGVDTLSLYSVGGIAYRPSVRVADFQAGAGGDRLDLPRFLADLLIGWEGDNPFGSGHLRLHQAGPNTRVEYRADTHGPWQVLLTLDGVDRATLTAENLGWSPDGATEAGVNLTGSADDDDFIGGDGADRYHGGSGDDYLAGGGGADVLYGERGRDTIDGGLGSDLVHGGVAGDLISDVWGGNDRLYGDGGNDIIAVGRLSSVSTDRILVDAGEGHDAVGYDGNYLNSVDLTVRLGAGDDAFLGGQTRHLTLDGGAGDDTVSIQYGGETSITTGDGSDGVEFVYSLGGNASFELGSGDDVLRIAPGPYAADYSVTLGSGADALVLIPFNGEVYLPDAFVVTDFETGAAGDLLVVDDWLQAISDWDGASDPFAAGYLRLHQTGPGQVLLEVDLDGAGAVQGFQTVMTLSGTSAAAFTADNLGGWTPAYIVDP